MKIRNLIICLIVLVTGIVNVEGEYQEYLKLENRKVPLIKKSDLPDEFSEDAFKTIIDFIEKTRMLDYEWMIYFDYFTGEVLKCVKGGNNGVVVDYGDGEFDGHLVASIHNHPPDNFSPPSYINFGILSRGFEDYELISGNNSFWILKVKGFYPYLEQEFRFMACLLFKASFDDSVLKYEGLDEINEECDKEYGKVLLKYINDKNIKDIQLSKLEYVTMSVKSEDMSADYNCLKKIYDPEEIRKARERIDNPNMLTGKDAVYAIFQLMGMEINYDEIFSD